MSPAGNIPSRQIGGQSATEGDPGILPGPGAATEDKSPGEQGQDKE